MRPCPCRSPSTGSASAPEGDGRSWRPTWRQIHRILVVGNKRLLASWRLVMGLTDRRSGTVYGRPRHMGDTVMHKRDQAQSVELSEEQLNEVSGGSFDVTVNTSSTPTSGTVQGV